MPTNYITKKVQKIKLWKKQIDYIKLRMYKILRDELRHT